MSEKLLKEADLSPGDEGYEDPPMTIWEHLDELRKRVLIAVVSVVVCGAVAWEFRELLLAFLVKPFAIAWIAEGIPGKPNLHFQTPAAAFFAYFRLSVMGGIVMSMPIIAYQVWSFVAPGLYAKEKRFVIPFVVSSSGLFVAGGYFGWKLVFPMAFKYLLSLASNLDTVEVGVTPTVMMGDYIAFVTRMLMGFGLISQIPILVFFLSVAGIINYLHLIRYSRWFIVLAFVIAAILTPPDPTSQIMMALPMLVLYAVSILLAVVFGKKPSDAQREHYRRRKEKQKEDRAETRRLKKERKASEKIAHAADKRLRAEKKRAQAAKKRAEKLG